MNIEVAGVTELIKRCSNLGGNLDETAKRMIDDVAVMTGREVTDNFHKATYAGTKDVDVTVAIRGKEATVTATGETLYFIEYGTGINYPSVTSKWQHGTYGKGQGANPKGWVYKGELGNGSGIPLGNGVIRTKGNPANLCIYNGIKFARKYIRGYKLKK